MTRVRRAAHRAKRVAQGAHAFISNDVVKLCLVVAGLFGEHKMQEHAQTVDNTAQLTTIGAVAAQVAEVRDSMRILVRHDARMDRRLMRLKHGQGAGLVPGPSVPPKPEGVVSGVRHFFSMLFGRGGS